MYKTYIGRKQGRVVSNKLALCGADSRLLHTSFVTLRDQRTSKSRNTKTRPNFKNPA